MNLFKKTSSYWIWSTLNNFGYVIRPKQVACSKVNVPFVLNHARPYHPMFFCFYHVMPNYGEYSHAYGSHRDRKTQVQLWSSSVFVPYMPLMAYYYLHLLLNLLESGSILRKQHEVNFLALFAQCITAVVNWFFLVLEESLARLMLLKLQ